MMFAAGLVPDTTTSQEQPTPSQHTTPVDPAPPAGCKGFVTQRKAMKRVRRTVLKRLVITKKAKQRTAKLIRCLKTDDARENVRRARGKLYRKRDVWKLRFLALSAYDRTWAKRIGSCESGNNPRTNTGNGFLGAMQWVLSTWHMAGGSGSPTQASIYEQWVRAVWWRNKTSTMQWPACSLKLGYA
jgi:hypothetical protein